MKTLVRQPSALLPLLMSLAALAVVVAHVTTAGAAPEKDEGAAAHLWQLLMAGQLPIVALFALKWLPRNPRKALLMLGLQAGAGAAALAPVFFLGL
jgi:hypothetical protein